jgi:selenide, water dikinase
VTTDPRVLVDYRTADDAGVYVLDADRALVQTVDFFTPIVDDPSAYGRIAAANALSDVYAMGGRPLTALAIAAFAKDVDRAAVKAVFAGGLEKLREADVALLGGHTVQDTEIKFGYAVTGEVRPDRLWSNAGARPGDAVFLTKPIGTGIIATALKFERAPAASVEAAVRSMETLNRAASDALRAIDGAVHACTDITGFGLVGHAYEIAAASHCTIEIDAESVPLLPGLRDLVSGNVPGGGRTNAQHFGATLAVAPAVHPELVQILHDPQTSGGLLVVVDARRASEVEEGLRRARVSVSRVGRVLERSIHLVCLR